MQTQTDTSLNKKIINNAISAYLMVFVCIFLLWNKNNPDINNDFVKAHVKSAFSIHVVFLLVYFIFISQNLFAHYYIFDMWVNTILAKWLFLLFLSFLVFWLFQAQSGKSFSFFSTLSRKKYIPIENKQTTNLKNEKDKLTLLLSYIPFIGFYIYGKHFQSSHVQYANRLNVVFTIVCIFLIALGAKNIFLLLLLGYSIYIVFMGITIFTQEQIKQIQLPHIFATEYKYIYSKALYVYMKNYLWDKKFIAFTDILKTQIQSSMAIEKQKNIKEIKTEKPLLAPWIIYFPIINFIFLFSKNNNYRTHIQNGLTLSVLFILMMISIYFFAIPQIFLLFFVIIGLFGIGYMPKRKNYAMPYIYGLFELSTYIASKVKKILRFVNTKRKQDVSTSIKVWEKK